jgi:hypothetical protein
MTPINLFNKFFERNMTFPGRLVEVVAYVDSYGLVPRDLFDVRPLRVEVCLENTLPFDMANGTLLKQEEDMQRCLSCIVRELGRKNQHFAAQQLHDMLAATHMPCVPTTTANPDPRCLPPLSETEALAQQAMKPKRQSPNNPECSE